MPFIFSRALTAVLKAKNPTSLTIALNLERSVTEASTCGRSMEISSNSLTRNRAKPAACS